MLQRREFLRLSVLLGAGILAGCAAQPDASAFSTQSEGASDASSSTDATSTRVVAASRSLAQMAILAGMPPVGVTEDAADLDGLPADVETVGTPAKPSLEKIVALAPTLVLITAEVPAQKELEAGLDGAGIAWRDVDVNGFGDYAAHMQALTEMSGRNDLYQANVADVSDAIAKVEESAAGLPQVSYLALLVSSTKAKVAKGDYFACEVFDNLQMANVTEDDSSLDDLSVEAIVAADPDYVFVIPRGDEDEAKAVFKQDFQAQPAWASLSAVKADRVNVLPKDLFEYKPNERWAEAYSYILDLREQEG
ncbi:ABC transporter substrate-binding protein [Olsenella sp. kh2p3]|uniref:ABC transporter substrate-binding protein n=1 Tax=Olsenella sp. kh2p3 TaxID=1797112 RepID=UPI00091C1531|nr:ABC transporter substrate-binding protein [Olsenella sp. kh2p3]SFX45566.1 iron complex transport system substrate-binding protein [Olsenella sp. kh2p3]